MGLSRHLRGRRRRDHRHLLRDDPDLVAERMRPPIQREQCRDNKNVLLDAQRFEWSQVPVALPVVGGLLVLGNFAVIARTARENAFLTPVVKAQPIPASASSRRGRGRTPSFAIRCTPARCCWCSGRHFCSARCRARERGRPRGPARRARDLRGAEPRRGARRLHRLHAEGEVPARARRLVGRPRRPRGRRGARLRRCVAAAPAGEAAGCARAGPSPR
jgi:hypothetical protein